MEFPEPPPLSPVEPTAATHAAIPFSVRLGCLLAWLGVCLCFLLLQRETAFRAFFCPARGGCEAVLGSRYAELRGIPLAWFGAAFYLTLLGLWLAVSAISSQRVRLWLLDGIRSMVLIGLTFSVGLMYIQFWLLHAFCPLCTASVLIVAASLVVARRARWMLAAKPAGASPAGSVTLALFAIFPALILVAGVLVKQRPVGGIQMIDLSTAHREGPTDARVQIAVYSDFQCVFCRQLVPVLQQLRTAFPQEVAIVFRHFPLESHPRAFAAAVAAECASEQGAFWEYHDKLFLEGGDLNEATLVAVASSLGLDQQRFMMCLQSEEPRRVVEANLREAMQLGLPGAPAVFINGRRIEGPLTFENLAKQIQALLRAPDSQPGNR